MWPNKNKEDTTVPTHPAQLHSANAAKRGENQNFQLSEKQEKLILASPNWKQNGQTHQGMHVSAMWY